MTEQTGPARQGSTERCTNPGCGHTKRDHDGRADHRARHSPLVAGGPWCHACNAACDYAAPAAGVAAAADQTELASLAVNAGRALQDEKRHYEIACQENARLRAQGEAHRLALSDALGLGTGAPWDAIQDRAAELHAGAGAQQQTDTETRETVHGCPPVGSGLTPCCGRTPFELPLGDRISSEAAVTCTGATPGAQQPAADGDDHVCKPGAQLYYCPTVGEVESDCHGGFDVCCSRPDLHRPACGKSRGVDGHRYSPCARAVGHREAYCVSASGHQLFIAEQQSSATDTP